MNQYSIFAARLPKRCSVCALVTIIMAGAVCPVQGQNALQQLEQRIVGEQPPAAAEGSPRSVVLGLEAEERGFSAPFQIVVLGVRPGSAAEAAGVRSGDEIVAFDNKTVASIEQMAEIVQDKRVGDDLSIVFRRSGQTLKTTARFTPAQSVPSPAASGSAPPGKGAAGSATQPVEPVAPLPTGGPRVDRPEPGSGRLGVTVENASTTPPGAGVPVRRGAVIVAVNPASPAASAGLEVGNAIVSINGVVIADAAALIEEISKTRPGDRIDLTVYKADVLTRVPVTLVDAKSMVAGSDGNAAIATPEKPLVAEKPSLLGGVFGGLFGNPRPNPADERGQATRPGAAGDGAMRSSDPPILNQAPVDGTAAGGFNPSAFSGFAPPSAGTAERANPNGEQEMPEPLPEPTGPPNNAPTDPQDVQVKEAEVRRLKMEVEMLRKQLEQLQQRLDSLQK